MRNTFVIEEQTSAIVEAGAVVLPRPVVLVPFFSKKGIGEDNELKVITQETLAKYGEMDYDHYGPHTIMIKRVLGAGGTVLGQRLVNKDDLCANVICNIVQDSTDTENFKFETNGVNGDAVKEFANLVSAVDGELDEASSSKVYPLFGLMSKATGIGGNDISIRMTANPDMSQYVNAQAYTLEIYDKGVLQYELVGTFTRQKFNGSPLYFPDVIRAMTDEYMMYIPDLSKLIAACDAFDGGVDFSKIDILGAGPEKFVRNGGTIDLTATSGVSLAEGAVAGTINGINNIEEAQVETEMESLLKEFFTGTINNELFNRLKYPIDLIIDPGYSTDVVKSIANGILQENESINFIGNMPKSPTFTAAEGAAKSTYSDIVGNTNIDMYGTYFSLFLPETSRYMEIPGTLFAVSEIIRCYQEGRPPAGRENLVVTGYEKIIPSIYKKEEVDALRKLGVNMFVENAPKTARPESETTFRTGVMGALSSISNRWILNDMMKISDEKAEDSLFLKNFNYSKYAKDLKNEILLTYQNSLKSLEVTAKRKGGNGLDQDHTAVTLTVEFNDKTDGFEHTFILKRSR